MRTLDKIRFEYVQDKGEPPKPPVIRTYINGVEVLNVINMTIEAKGKRTFVTLEFEAQVEVTQVEQ